MTILNLKSYEDSKSFILVNHVFDKINHVFDKINHILVKL